MFIGPYFFLNDLKFNIYVKGNLCVQKFNYIILSFFLPLRLYFILEFFLYNSRFYSGRAQRFFSVYRTKVSLTFSMKGTLKSNPKVFLFCLFFLNIFMNSFLIYIWERVGENFPERSFDNFYTCLWFAFTTMTQLGYGETFPTSIIGRLISFYIIMVGVIVLSMFTVILTKIFLIKNSELRVYDSLELISYKEQINRKIEELVLKTMKFYKNLMMKYRKKQDKEENKGKRMDANVEDPEEIRKFQEKKAKEKKLDKLLYKLEKEKSCLIKEIKVMKRQLASKTNINYNDIISERLSTIKTMIKGFKKGISEFQSIFENSMEINRTLTGIENAINN